jgi:choline kinase
MFKERNQAFCILAAGRGERLQKVMKLHKCLAPINNKAVISHIIDKAPPDAEIIIALGHQGQIVKEYCEAAHPDRKFTFIKVDNYDGPGSGPGYSLSCCKHYLQRPFYLFCGDCIVEEPLPNLDYNWMGVVIADDPRRWSTAQLYDGQVVKFKNKAPDGYEFAFIGVAGIKDYEIFWAQMKHTDHEFEMVSAFYDPMAYGELRAIHFTWHDTGTPENYNKSREALGWGGLGMVKEIDEITYKVGDRCVKVFGDENVALSRIERCALLHGLVPCLVYYGEHVYAYNWLTGSTMYEKATVPLMEKFLEWCEKWLWLRIDVAGQFMDEQCEKFYKQKTYARLRSYLAKRGIDRDMPEVIKGRQCESIETYLERVDWKRLQDGVAGSFHGDLQFENVIVTPDEDFRLIDWRDCFGTCRTYGDIYYDLAKLNSGLMMCYHKIKLGSYFVRYKDGGLDYWFDYPQELHEIRVLYENWLLKRGYDLYKVRVLTALIYLNMAPLHTAGFDDLLFCHSKYLLSMLL